jgi:hypothetical protein
MRNWKIKNVDNFYEKLRKVNKKMHTNNATNKLRLLAKGEYSNCGYVN